MTLRAAVSPVPDAGAVTFTDGGVAVPGCVVSLTPGKAGQASCQAAFLRAGTHMLAAAYPGDSFYSASASAGVAQSVVSAAPGTRGPVISGASLSPRRFRSTRPTTLRLTLNEPATLTVTITGPRRGRLVGHRCSRKAHRGRRCLVQVRRGQFRFHAGAGRRSFTLRLRRLTPGRYTAEVVATDGARRRSKTIRLGFTITGVTR